MLNCSMGSEQTQSETVQIPKIHLVRYGMRPESYIANLTFEQTREIHAHARAANGTVRSLNASIRREICDAESSTESCRIHAAQPYPRMYLTDPCW